MKKFRLTLMLLLMMIMMTATSSVAFASDDIQKLKTGDEVIDSADIDTSQVGINTVNSPSAQKLYVKNVSGGIRVYWDKVSKATQYVLYRKNGSRWIKLRSTEKTAFVDTGAKAGVYNYYKLYTKVNSRYADPVSRKIICLRRPVIQLKNLNHSVYITWSESKGATSYYVYRKKAGGKYEKAGLTSELSFKDKAVGSDYGSYKYYVRAVNGRFLSGYKAQSIDHKHVHAYTSKIIRHATSDICGLKRYTCSECGRCYEKPTAPTGTGKYLLSNYNAELTKALNYQIREPGYQNKNRTNLKPVNDINTPRYWKYPDGIYRSSSVISDGAATITFTGDCMCQSSQQTEALAKYGKYQFKDNFNYVRNIFGASDFVVGNLECTTRDSVSYMKEERHVDSRTHCNAPSTFMGALRYAGFDMMVTSNNHNCDTGVVGHFETLSHLDQYGLIHTGTFRSEKDKRYEIVEIDGIKVAFLSYGTYFNHKNENWTEEGQEILLNPYSRARVFADVKNAKADGAEYVVAYLHSGTEYTHEINEKQEVQAQTMADAGVDYIIGSHPHVLQPYRLINAEDGRTVPIVYSMGNFVSHMNSEEARASSIILQIQLKRNKSGQVYLAGEGYIPVKTIKKFKGNNYTVLPLTEPYNTTGFSGLSGISKAYDNIVDVIGPGLNVMGKFNK